MYGRKLSIKQTLKQNSFKYQTISISLLVKNNLHRNFSPLQRHNFFLKRGFRINPENYPGMPWIADMTDFDQLKDSIGLSESFFSMSWYAKIPYLVVRLTHFLHDSVGLEWWIAIISINFLLKLALYPITIKRHKYIKGLALKKVYLKRLADAFNEISSKNNAEKTAKAREKLLSCTPHIVSSKSFFAMFVMQMFIHVSAFYGIRSLTNYNIAEMATGGAFFFKDLTAKNTLVFPVILTILNYTLFKELLEGLSKINFRPEYRFFQNILQSKKYRTIANLLIISFFFILYKYNFATGFLLHLVSSFTFNILDRKLFQSELYCKFLNITTATEIKETNDRDSKLPDSYYINVLLDQKEKTKDEVIRESALKELKKAYEKKHIRKEATKKE